MDKLGSEEESLIRTMLKKERMIFELLCNGIVTTAISTTRCAPARAARLKYLPRGLAAILLAARYNWLQYLVFV